MHASMGPRFSAWKTGVDRVVTHHGINASMGPRLRERGSRLLISWNVSPLHTSKEPRSLKYGNTAERIACITLLPLQWSHAFSSVEVDHLRRNSSGNWRASMGPHSFKCGSRIMLGCFTLARIAASMRPRFSKVEVYAFALSQHP